MRYLDIMQKPNFIKTANDLAQVVQFLAAQGWTPATSSNFSARIPDENALFAISQSGVDKTAFAAEHVMVVDEHGRAVAPLDAKPSAETLLHTLLYEDPDVGSVLHTHSLPATVLSMRHLDQGMLQFAGLEILKGLRGNQTHDLTETLPIFPNSQDMVTLAKAVRRYGREHPEMHGFLIAGHGLYTWGRDLREAKRHIETLEFLMAYLMHV